MRRVQTRSCVASIEKIPPPSLDSRFPPCGIHGKGRGDGRRGKLSASSTDPQVHGFHRKSSSAPSVNSRLSPCGMLAKGLRGGRRRKSRLSDWTRSCVASEEEIPAPHQWIPGFHRVESMQKASETTVGHSVRRVRTRTCMASVEKVPAPCQ